jgi:hypothetical protein
VPLPRVIRSACGGAERLFDRILCVVGAILFSQFPEFMQQYLQRLEGHLDEARLAVDRFRDAASQSGMSLDQLVASSAKNPDPSMGKLGAVVHAAVTRVDDLAATDTALRGASIWSKPFVFFSHMDPGIARATLNIYQPALPTTMEGFIYAGIGIVLVLSIYHLAVRAPIARHFRRRSLAIA